MDNARREWNAINQETANLRYFLVECMVSCYVYVTDTGGKNGRILEA